MRTVLSRIYDFCEFQWKKEPYFTYGCKRTHFSAYSEPYGILGENKLTYIIIYLFPYLLTPSIRVFLEKLTGFKLVKKSSAFYGTRRLITAFTSARQLSPWASLIQSMFSYPTSWRSILILCSHLRLSHPSGPFPSWIPTKTMYTSLFSPYALYAAPI